MRIILASNSPRRKEILTQVGVKHIVIPSGFEERANDMKPEEMVKYFSYMKAKDVYCKLLDERNSASYFDCKADEGFVVGSDTIVYCDKIMGKPKDDADAFEMLKKLSGREHYVMSGISVIRLSNGDASTEYEKTKVRIKKLSDTDIAKYIATREPMDKAGAYAIQGIGSLFVEGIEGCYFNVVGLPVFRFARIMESFGYSIL